MVEKWSLQALENSLELEIMEPFQFQFFHRCIVGATVCHVFRELPLD